MLYYRHRLRNLEQKREVIEMYGYEMEHMIIMGDMLDELREWEDFEADLAEGNPWE